MKNLISAKNATKTINEIGLVDVLAFNQTGERNNTYGGLNALQAFRHMVHQLSQGLKVLVIPHYDRVFIEGDQKDTLAYEKYSKHAVTFGHYNSDNYSPQKTKS
jgi:hypothetical protein